MLSICMIVRNEAQELPSLLRNIGFADEIVAVDTGSTDRSKKILTKHPKVSLYSFSWNSHFAEARNYALSKAKGDWILVLDADERLDDPTSLYPLLQASEIDAYDIIMHNLQPKGSLTKVEKSRLPRLFRNKGYRYEGAIHEQLSPSLTAMGAKRAPADFVIVHHGYMYDAVQGGESRFARNLAILESEIEKNPQDYYYVYHLALMSKIQDPARSKELFLKALEMGKTEMPAPLKAQSYMRLAQMALEQEEHAEVIHRSKQALQYEKSNVIAKVCLISSLCAINAFVQAAVVMEDVIAHHLEEVGNPQDFLSLYEQLKQLGLIQ